MILVHTVYMYHTSIIALFLNDIEDMYRNINVD